MSESSPLLYRQATSTSSMEAIPQRHFPKAVKNFVFSINVLLLLLPFAILSASLGWNDVLTGVLNFLTIIPLSGLVSNASDTIGDRLGELAGGLANATFGNTVELIVGILAISHNELNVAQSIMVGSILSDILFVLGYCIITAAGPKGVVSVNSAMIQSLSSLMLVIAMALALPTALYATFPSTTARAEVKRSILSFSRATVVVLLIIYSLYLVFQLKTHSDLFTSQGQDIDQDAYQRRSALPTESPGAETTRSLASSNEAEDDDNEEDDEDEAPSLKQTYIAGGILFTASLLIGKCTHNFMESLNGMTQALNISKIFVALFIIPIASNAPEFTQVVAASKKQKVSFAIGVIIGSILQIALSVLPILVVIAWIAGRPLDLYFEASQTYVLLIAVLLVNQVLQDKQYTYLHGIMLISTYLILAVAYFIQPSI